MDDHLHEIGYIDGKRGYYCLSCGKFFSGLIALAYLETNYVGWRDIWNRLRDERIGKKMEKGIR